MLAAILSGVENETVQDLQLFNAALAGHSNRWRCDEQTNQTKLCDSIRAYKRVRNMRRPPFCLRCSRVNTRWPSTTSCWVNSTEIPPAPAGESKIEVTFEIDQDGILNVTAVVGGTGKKNEIRITDREHLTKEQFDQIVRGAAERSEANRRKVSTRSRTRSSR